MEAQASQALRFFYILAAHLHAYQFSGKAGCVGCDPCSVRDAPITPMLMTYAYTTKSAALKCVKYVIILMRALCKVSYVTASECQNVASS